RWTAAPCSRTPAARAAAISAGPCSRNQGGTTSARVCSSSSSPNRADAAEIVVPGGPAPHNQPAHLELGQRSLVDTGLGVNHVAGRMETRPVDRFLRLQPLVED